MFTETGPCEEIALEGSRDVALEESKPEEEVINTTDIIDETVTQIKVTVSERIMKLKWSEMPVDCYVAYVCEETGEHVVSYGGTPTKFNEGSINVEIDLSNVKVITVVILVPTYVTSPASKLLSDFSVWVCGEF